MNKATRMLTLIGMGMLTGATIGIGPAQAAAPAAAPTTTTTVTTAGQGFGDDDEELVGYYRTGWACERAGRIGERFGAWDDYDCERVRWGFRAGAWALVVDEDQWDDDWEDDWRPGFWPGNWPHRPHWPGHGHWFGGRR